jgi:hypothetical protein
MHRSPTRTARSLVAIVTALLLLSAPPATAAAAPVVVPVEATFPAGFLNPCTGEGFHVTITGTLRLHAFTLTNGTEHIDAHLSVDVTTDDGFSGRARHTFVANTSGPSGSVAISDVFQLTLSDEAGHRVAVHAVMHATVAAGEPVVAIERFTARCVGVPSLA